MNPNKEYEDIEGEQYKLEIEKIKNNPDLIYQQNKKILNKVTKIVTMDGVQRPGKLPPLNPNYKPQLKYLKRKSFIFAILFERQNQL